ncbi:hypothetical protein AAG570_000675 [Ranatra chinensis]|uniref:Uncharacterized protein n=1 Tax=Ranatra chinensis TaxID=642074 RepID=A0ABD0YXQ9_9HEMI
MVRRHHKLRPQEGYKLFNTRELNPQGVVHSLGGCPTVPEAEISDLLGKTGWPIEICSVLMMDHKLSAKILEKKGPGWTVVSIEYASATNKGDGNASQMVRATVHLQSGNLRETLTLILKKQPESKAFSEFLNQFSVFQTEINVYTLVISQMEELMAEYSDQRGPLWCKFWGHDGNEFLILEDLKIGETLDP